MAYYTLKNAHSSKYLAIANYNGSLSNNQNVCVTSLNTTVQANNSHIWSISSLGSGVYAKAYVNTAFGLNVYRAGDPYNCDVYPISGNETDAKVNFIFHVASGQYFVKLSNYNLYLTISGDNVCWKPYGGENDNTQKWYINTATPSATPTSRTLSMPQNLNQKYNNNDDVIIRYGCCVCCVCDVASYYGGVNYTLQQMKNWGVYSSIDATCNWGNAPSASFAYHDLPTQNDYFAKIRSEINAGRPVIVYMVGEDYQHYVVAYGYTNGGNTYANIQVLDPYNDDGTTPVGRYVSLATALEDQYCTSINRLVLTSRK
ncbi:MAG: hypothetical protein IJ389_04010 [Clostridia bacterium]|nr:hypothetical protein [Clostridia bacterium]